MTINGEELRWPGSADLWQWLQIIGYVCGIVIFFVMLGMTIGPLRDAVARIGALESKVTEHGFDIQNLKSARTSIDERMNLSEKDRRELHEILSKTIQLAENSVSRLEFSEWLRQFERENKNLSAPVLKKDRDK